MAKNRTGKKQPGVKAAPQPTKVPRIDSQALTSETEHGPIWRFSLFDLELFGWKDIKLDGAVEIVNKLKSFENMTWQQIKQQTHGKKGKSSSHEIPVSRLCHEAQNRLKTLNQNDVDSVFSLRCGGTERIFGIKQGPYLKILWYDPDHQICPI